MTFDSLADEKIIKKIIKAKHIYGLSYYDQELYLSNVFNDYVSKIELKKNYKIKKLKKLSKGWKSFNLTNKGELYGVHSIEFIDKNKLFFLSYLEKKIIFYDFKENKKKDYYKLNKILKGPSHIFYDKDKNNLLISDYDGSEVYQFNLLNLSIKKLSNLLNVKFKKPHMTIKNKNKFYILDTKLKKIIIANEEYDLIDEINKENVYFNDKEHFKNKFLQEPVSIKIDSFGNYYIADVGENNCIYIINKNKKLIGIIENKKILKNNFVYNLKNLNLNKIYDLSVVNEDIFIASTHTNSVFQIKNVFINND